MYSLVSVILHSLHTPKLYVQTVLPGVAPIQSCQLEVLQQQAFAHSLCSGTGPTGGAGPSQYGAVGFSYAGGDARSGSESDSGDSSSSDDDRNDDERSADLAADGLAANVGVDNFSLMLHRAEQQEEDEMLGRAPRKKCASDQLESTLSIGIADCWRPSGMQLTLNP